MIYGKTKARLYLEDLRAGMTLTGVADKNGRHLTTVRSCVLHYFPDDYKALGLKRGSPGRVSDDVAKRNRLRAQQYCDQLRAGMTLQRLADEQGVSRQSIQQFVVRWAPDSYTRRYRTRTEQAAWDADEDRVLSFLWSEGHSFSEIGRRIGRHRNQIARRVRRLRLPEREQPASLRRAA